MNTHPHANHAGGLPALVAEGATIITQKNNLVFLEKALNTPRTLLNDTLAKNPKKAKFEAVSGKRVCSDGAPIVEMYHVYPIPHTNGMMIAYIPFSSATSRCPLPGNQPTITSKPWFRFLRNSISTSIAISTCTPLLRRRARRTCGKPLGNKNVNLRTNNGAIRATLRNSPLRKQSRQNP